MKQIIFCLIGLALSTLSFAQTGKGEYVGGDISLLSSYEASNTVYLDASGNKISDLIPWLMKECGWNSFRVRLFVNPKKVNQKGEFDPAVCQDIDYVKVLGKRIKDAGAKFMLDFHYSDTWTDPGSHSTPQAWLDEMSAQSITTTDSKVKFLADKMYSYTKESLKTLSDYGATPDLIQVGNEINGGLLWPTGNCGADGKDGQGTWSAFASYLAAGCKACRETCPDAKIALHVAMTNSGWVATTFPSTIKTKALSTYTVQDYGLIDYDIIGLSYYPADHGKLSTLKSTINTLASDFPDKKVQIVETGYYFQYWPTSASYDTRSTWACSADGQHQFVKDLIAELANHNNVDGLFYWFPEEAGDGDAANWTTKEGVVISGWLNRGLWWPSIGGNNGHWPLASNGTMTVSLFKDFLSEEAAGINIIDDNENNNENNNIYNLSGQKVGKDYKGIVIKNGKKFLEK